MYKYLIPFLFYVVSEPLIELLTGNIILSYSIRTAGTGIFLLYFYKQYRLKFRLSLPSMLIGILIFILWIVLDPMFPHLGTSSYEPATTYAIVIKIIGFLLIAPLIEELFVRDFLVRFFIGKNWRKVRIGTFGWLSFVITVLFFGFSHNQWLSALVVGIVLNLLLYKTKRIDTCIQAHFVANLVLAIFILYSGQWVLW
ncbi:CAAX prenyl protease-related protein [Candidatus Woesearchaeota archaeon]|nr:CAAX prenyl protease-related protein [Candidatus Woesearchaeota archaeon]